MFGITRRGNRRQISDISFFIVMPTYFSCSLTKRRQCPSPLRSIFGILSNISRHYFLSAAAACMHFRCATLLTITEPSLRPPCSYIINFMQRKVCFKGLQIVVGVIKRTLIIKHLSQADWCNTEQWISLLGDLQHKIYLFIAW